MFHQEPTTKRAILYGDMPHDWRWSAKNPVNFLCHSQGGYTIRFLIELLSGEHEVLHPGYFGGGDKRPWVKSISTPLGSPHMGSTITDVVQVRVSNIYRSSCILILDYG